MRIRSQFVLTFVLLAVVPLAAIVAYSYASSQAAVRKAVESEAAQLTGEMQRRMDSVQDDLRARVERVGALPFGRMMAEPQDEGGDKRWLMGRVLSELGEVAPLVESFEFIVTPSEEGEFAWDVTTQPELAPAPSAPPQPFAQRMVMSIEEILAEVEEGLEEGEIDFDTEEALATARAGLEAAGTIAQGVTSLVQAFQGGGGGHLDEEGAEHLAPTAPPLIPLDELERERLVRNREAARARAGLLRDSELNIPVHREGHLVGEVKAQVSGGEVLHRVLERTRRDQGEIPFAMDEEGELYAASEEDRELLSDLPLDGATGGEEPLTDWVLVTSEESSSGVTFGIARPIGEPLQEVREAAVRNLALGLGLIGIALLGIVPLSGRMTRDLKEVTHAADRIARGELETEVAVHSKNEIGQLAASFNRMSRDLNENRGRLVEEERRRREQEVRESLLQAEFDRKTEELEGARSFQLSLLPKDLPTSDAFEVAVFMETAAEVGGDYYDFRSEEDGGLTVAVGDATGHGARAGTMVTIVKALFSAYPPEAGLTGFLEEAHRAIKRMDLGRMAMALALARLSGRELTVSSAGMPPALLFRAAEGEVEEVALQGMPLGGLDFDYRQATLEVAPGDALLLMSDGFPELPNGEGDPLGYERVTDLFGEAATQAPEELIATLSHAAGEWAGGGAPNDDITFVALRVR